MRHVVLRRGRSSGAPPEAQARGSRGARGASHARRRRARVSRAARRSRLRRSRGGRRGGSRVSGAARPRRGRWRRRRVRRGAGAAGFRGGRGPGAFGVALVGDDHDAVGVRERALSLLVGIAGEAAGALATLEHSAAVGADRGVGCDRSGEPTDRFSADVAWCGAREQTDVAFRHSGGAQCLDRAARRDLGGICLGERGHGDVLRRGPCRWVGRAIMRWGGCGGFASW
jgi:hypothetical protein